MTDEINQKEFVAWDADNAIRALRDYGYAIVIFNPEELNGANPDHVEERLIELGWDVIETLSN